MQNLPTLKGVELKNKTVMIRVAYDVPLDSTKNLLDAKRVKDDSRIMETIPTLSYIIKGNPKKIILLAGWVGRPEGEDKELSMAPAVLRLQEILKVQGLLKHPILLAPNCLDGSKPRSAWRNKEEVKKIVADAKDSQIVVLENVRYDKEANSNYQEFAKFIASLAGKNAVYVNEAEPQNHRPEATIVSVPIYIAKMGGKCCFGFKYAEVVKHMASISKELDKKDRGPFVFFLSGKKIESQVGITSKITVANTLLDTMRGGDALIVLGGVAYTFLISNEFINRIGKTKDSGKKNDKEKAKKLVGNSFVEWEQFEEQLKIAEQLILKTRKKNVDILLPTDHVITNKFPDRYGNLPKDSEIKFFNAVTRIPDGWLAVAPGPKTLKQVCDKILKSSILLLAGPLSIEDERVENFSNTNKMLLSSVKEAKNKGAITIAAGGDTSAMVKKYKGEETFVVISTAGGATLELIEKGTSPAIEAIIKCTNFKQSSK